MDVNVIDTDLVIARRIPAPPEAVFAAWTDAEQVKRWWGPRGVTTPVAEIALHAGGHHHAVMHDPSGAQHPSRLAIDEVAAPHRLVLRATEAPLAGATATVRFDADPIGTLLQVRWRHPTAAMCATHRAMGFEKGWGETLDKLGAHVATPTASAACPMSTPLTIEHGWLQRLLGEWTYESEATMGPDQPPMRASGRESVRALGGYWVVGEGDGTMPGGMAAQWIVTVGFDAKAGRFRGSWVGSMMGHLFIYDGALSEDGRTLTLENEGPSFSGEGLSRYRDITILEGDDRRVLASEVQNADGSWTRFMTARFTRAG